MSITAEVPPEVITISNCMTGKMELPDGGMALIFDIAGVRRYQFILDPQGRKVVAGLCGPGVATYGPGDMPRRNHGG